MPTEPADRSADAHGALIPQVHGGALRAGGKPGNKGGGRPKEQLRDTMRELLGVGLDQMRAQIAGEYLAADAVQRIMRDPRIRELDEDVQTLVQTVARESCTVTLTPGELQRTVETLAKFGVGTQQQIEKEETRRYIVQLPERGTAAREIAAAAHVQPAGVPEKAEPA